MGWSTATLYSKKLAPKKQNFPKKWSKKSLAVDVIFQLKKVYEYVGFIIFGIRKHEM